VLTDAGNIFLADNSGLVDKERQSGGEGVGTGGADSGLVPFSTLVRLSLESERIIQLACGLYHTGNEKLDWGNGNA